MQDAVAALQRIVAREDVFGVVVPDFSKVDFPFEVIAHGVEHIKPVAKMQVNGGNFGDCCEKSPLIPPTGSWGQRTRTAASSG